ncbi:MAG: methyltransferase domain-containing protein [Anaerolineales bacterium]|jgi:ubiquinone/menaquinone biosynthesis C-methylase UbiE|nr:methyltransferase domain-containing protein [Anaerolineales bacterium]
MKDQPTFFDFAAEVGLTKHIGGVGATEALIELCHIGKDSYVLDVGCGVGATACLIAKRVGCRVVGVDILEKMVERSRERAAREKLTPRVDFRVADAQNLPFEDHLFDAVLTESVTAFPEDKQKAVSEYARVTKSGGYVGLNETTWLKTPPPPEVVAWAAQEVGRSVKPLTADEWAGLLHTAGLKEITTQIHPVDLQEETKGILQRYGWAGMFQVMGRMLRLYVQNPLYRDFVQRIRQGGVIPDHLQEYFGYGLFVGQKE